jgi:hypothetical protein
MKADPLRNEPGSQVRGRIMDQMLICSGRWGYRNVSVKTLCRELGSDEGDFHACFESEADCFHSAYEMGIADLTRRLLHASEGGRGSLPDALSELGRFIAANREQAKALFVEVHSVGEPSVERRRTALDELGRSLDRAYRRAGSPAPAITGSFLVHAIDHLASDLLIDDRADEFQREVSGIVALADEAYGAETETRPLVAP